MLRVYVDLKHVERTCMTLAQKAECITLTLAWWSISGGQGSSGQLDGQTGQLYSINSRL